MITRIVKIEKGVFAIEYKRQRADVCDGEEEEEYEQIKQKVCSDCPSHKDDDCGYVKRQLQRKCNYLSDVMYGYELGRQSKPKVSEDVEEEYKDYVESDPVYSKLVNRNAGLSIARHFAQWGAEHAKECEECPSRGNTHSYLKGLEDGKKEMKEQMMKEAVEGEVVQDIQGVNRVKSFSKVPDWLHFGQKVRIIIVKED